MSALDNLIEKYTASISGRGECTSLECAVVLYGSDVAATELLALQERVKQLEAVVKRLEYIEEYPSEESLCPICRGEKPTHYEDCDLAIALELK